MWLSWKLARRVVIGTCTFDLETCPLCLGSYSVALPLARVPLTMDMYGFDLQIRFSVPGWTLKCSFGPSSHMIHPRLSTHQNEAIGLLSLTINPEYRAPPAAPTFIKLETWTRDLKSLENCQASIASTRSFSDPET
ncbi:uncharacterized protein C8Q71DRAFT_721615 [Rhodofomes roseus]|uniref:Uncharacterized protein n=1 Tax=Rhodofomes roseus TaxID=34475 RepID=A0ABQ8KNJ1_9APHY|nr:uncharacterized protein C8Q71DRAFT_721615 [Rhodofomes roseus]KAH9839784.1 hypothetical protein C8Q71DRAFT_721615 [Rhodofomes roseus]